MWYEPFFRVGCFVSFRYVSCVCEVEEALRSYVGSRWMATALGIGIWD